MKRLFSTISLLSKVKLDLKKAMMEKKDTLVLKSILSDFNYTIKSNPNVTDVDLVNVLHKMIKKRSDSIEQYMKAGRNDLVSNEQEELKIVQSYLPPQLTEEEIEIFVKQAITKVDATSSKDFGKVMKELRSKLDSSVAPNAVVSKVVKLLLP